MAACTLEFEEFFSYDFAKEFVRVADAAFLFKEPVDVCDVSEEEVVRSWVFECYCLCHVDEDETFRSCQDVVLG